MTVVRSGSAAGWRPVTTNPAFLTFVILISILLIVLLQTLLVINNKNGGILFAEHIHSLAPSQTFAYLYLPVIVSVVYGFLWTWIDLDVRRLEPYFQLAQKDGALGRDSLLLDYTVGFILFVPFRACRKRHWSVFLASTATLLALWGLTPAQAGVFAVIDTNQTTLARFMTSTADSSVDKAHGWTAEVAQSVASILWMNETLQPWMTRNYAIRGVYPREDSSIGADTEYWTFPTELYSVNVTCETPIYGGDPQVAPYMNSSWGCHLYRPDPRTSTLTSDKEDQIYDSRYIGYWDSDDRQFTNLQEACPANESNTFIIQFSKALIDGNRFSNSNYTTRLLNANITERFCRPHYYMQDVIATASADAGHRVHSVMAVSEPVALTPNYTNFTLLETAMARGQEIPAARSYYPSAQWPDLKPYFLNSSLHLEGTDAMSLFALSAYKRPFDDYNDPAVLDAAIEAAYRLLLARRLADMQGRNMIVAGPEPLKRVKLTRAVVMIPVFTYIAEGLLGLIVVLTIVLLWSSKGRESGLIRDPSCISAVLDLSVNDENLFEYFLSHNGSTTTQLRKAIGEQRFRLYYEHDSGQPFLSILRTGQKPGTPFSQIGRESSTPRSIKGVQPFEMTLKTGSVFLIIQAAMFLGVLTIAQRISAQSGLGLPSSSELIRRVLENYIPIAIATLMESIWLVLNRQLCAMQPFETLRCGPARSKDSIQLAYSNKPPQFALFGALKRQHFLLAVVCTTPFLANILSVAMSSLLFEDVASSFIPVAFNSDFPASLQYLNGSAAAFTPSNAPGLRDIFSIATSHFTAGTPLPAWTDDEFFYAPFGLRNTSIAKKDDLFRANTTAIGARLQCRSQTMDGAFVVRGPKTNNAYSKQLELYTNLTLPIPRNDGSEEEVICTNGVYYNTFTMNPIHGPVALEFNTYLTPAEGYTNPEHITFCQSHVAMAWLRANITYDVTQNSSGLYNTVFDIHEQDAILLICKPDLVSGTADITVNAMGNVIQRNSFHQDTVIEASLFPHANSSAADLFAQAHYFLTDCGCNYHSDDYFSDFINYLLFLDRNVHHASMTVFPAINLNYFQRLVVPGPRYQTLYNKLFAIFLGHHRDLLFGPHKIDLALNDTISMSKSSSLESLSSGNRVGQLIRVETRVYMSPTFMFIAEIILGIYMLTTILLYARRPWRILTRLPDTPASIIAYFAGSQALLDRQKFLTIDAKVCSDTLTHTDKLGVSENIRELDGLEDQVDGSLLRFGSYVGTDGLIKVGIGNAELVKPLVVDARASHDARRGWWKRRVLELIELNRRKVRIASYVERRSMVR